MRLLLLSLIFTASCAAQKGDLTLVVGTYTRPGKSEGIYVYHFNAKTGDLQLKNKATGIHNPSYLAISRDGRFVYAANEDSDKGKGGLSAFSFDAGTGSLNLLNFRKTGGDAPCYVSVTDDNRYAFAANYGGGSLTALRINADGTLGEDVQVVQNSGSSVNPSRQEGPHVHTAVVSPDQQYVLSTDLGTDKVHVHRITNGGGEEIIAPAPTPFVPVEPGSGPRHLAYHPNGQYLYLVHEMEGAVSFYTYANAALQLQQRISMLAKGDTGRIGAADIHVSPDGNFLYASNRGDANVIVIYKIAPDGKLTWTGKMPTGGNTPRNFVIDPTGNFLLVANQNSDNIVVFRRDKNTGLLTPTGKTVSVGSPSCLQFAAPSRK